MQYLAPITKMVNNLIFCLKKAKALIRIIWNILSIPQILP